MNKRKQRITPEDLGSLTRLLMKCDKFFEEVEKCELCKNPPPRAKLAAKIDKTANVEVAKACMCPKHRKRFVRILDEVQRRTK